MSNYRSSPFRYWLCCCGGRARWSRVRNCRELWPADTFVEFDQGLNTAIKKIRQALGDSADNPRFVETIPRKGYRFIAPVLGTEEPVAERQTPMSHRHALQVWAL